MDNKRKKLKALLFGLAVCNVIIWGLCFWALAQKASAEAVDESHGIWYNPKFVESPKSP